MVSEEERRAKREQADALARGEVSIIGESQDVDSIVATLRRDLQKNRPVPDGTVMRWTTSYNYGEQRFTYVALFVRGAWYVSGKGNRFPAETSHEGLMNALVTAGERVIDLEVADTWKPVTL